MEVCLIIITCMIIFISWAFLKYADIPIELYVRKVSELENSEKLVDISKIGVGASVNF